MSFAAYQDSNHCPCHRRMPPPCVNSGRITPLAVILARARVRALARDVAPRVHPRVLIFAVAPDKPVLTYSADSPFATF